MGAINIEKVELINTQQFLQELLKKFEAKHEELVKSSMDKNKRILDEKNWEQKFSVKDFREEISDYIKTLGDLIISSHTKASE